MATTSRAQEKLETDLLNFAFKPMALLLNPTVAIILFSLALYFSWKHNKAHLKKTDLIKSGETEAERLHRERKRQIIVLRMRFDAIGLLASIIVLALQLMFAATQLQSFFNGILLMAAVAMVASSTMSTAHKAYRFRKADYEWSPADGFRVVFGLAGTVILAGILFHFIPHGLMLHPVVIAGTTAIMLGLAIHKTYRVYQEQKIHAKRLQEIDNAGNTIDSLASKDQIDTLLILRKDGDYDFDAILDARLNHMVEQLNTVTITRDMCLMVKYFFEQLDIDAVYISKLIDSQPRYADKQGLKERVKAILAGEYVIDKGVPPAPAPLPIGTAVKKTVTWSLIPPSMSNIPPAVQGPSSHPTCKVLPT